MAYPGPNVWDAAATLKLWRMSPSQQKPQFLESGVNYFVLMLEQLGCETYFSCEGHPDGFYIIFSAPYELALKIQSAGYFAVGVGGRNEWSLRFGHKHESKTYLRYTMRWAAQAWEERLGPLDLQAAVTEVRR